MVKTAKKNVAFDWNYQLSWKNWTFTKVRDISRLFFYIMSNTCELYVCNLKFRRHIVVIFIQWRQLVSSSQPWKPRQTSKFDRRKQITELEPDFQTIKPSFSLCKLEHGGLRYRLSKMTTVECRNASMYSPWTHASPP